MKKQFILIISIIALCNLFVSAESYANISIETITSTNIDATTDPRIMMGYVCEGLQCNDLEPLPLCYKGNSLSDRKVFLANAMVAFNSGDWLQIAFNEVDGVAEIIGYSLMRPQP